ncbi:hypothetical protein MKW92_032092 [Papaver armeniacum]|nr:hypothetical protein MKW92_032092 [Papaver armeniacum]
MSREKAGLVVSVWNLRNTKEQPATKIRTTSLPMEKYRLNKVRWVCFSFQAEPKPIILIEEGTASYW